ncbi:MAG: hypothetical protein R3E68_02200 [Burkholderiaceae bacterium]
MQATATEQVKELMANKGAVTRALGAAKTNQLIATEYDALEKVAKAIGLEKK